MKKQTCGLLYQEGLQFFTEMDPQKIPLFAAGFVSGQAEKIYLGACQAAMFRPSDKWMATVTRIVSQVSDRYDLCSTGLDTSRGRELWLCSDNKVLEKVRRLKRLKENSPAWHKIRGALCGIPEDAIDIMFHDRTGFGDPCDACQQASELELARRFY